jgi:hypothetical protein
MKILNAFRGVAFGAALILTSIFILAAAPADPAKPEVSAKAYPLTTCIVTDEKLGDMGDPFVFVHQGQEIKLCCKSCKKKFDKTPETFLKKLTKVPATK